MAKLEAGRVGRCNLDDATTMSAGYWDNNGEPIRFDYEQGYREDTSIRANVDGEVVRTASAIDAMVRHGNTDFSVNGAAHPSVGYPETENWQKTVGGYQQWSSADVSVKGGVVTMVVTVHAEDYDNVNPDQSDIASGAGDNENGRFTEIGWAHPFVSSGDVTRTVTWPVGEPPPDVTGGAQESRSPGREDRVDERQPSAPADPTTTATPAGCACHQPTTVERCDPSGSRRTRGRSRCHARSRRPHGQCRSPAEQPEEQHERDTGQGRHGFGSP